MSYKDVAHVDRFGYGRLMESDSTALTISDPESSLAVSSLPRLIVEAHPTASFVWDEFFSGMIRNPHTRDAYQRAVRRFLIWAEQQDVALLRITPGMIGRYFDVQASRSVPTKKLELAALRAFFDVLVNRHVLPLNPAATVRGERYQAVEGKTPEITPEQARTLLRSIPTDRSVALRDRAIIATLIYTAARAGAVAKLKREDFIWDGAQYSLRFTEKGGKSRSIPVRHDLQLILLEYLYVLNTEQDSPHAPLFRTAAGRTGQLTPHPLRNIDICRMVKRRLRNAGLPSHLSPHSFRVATVTDLLTQGVSLEDVQYLAGHSDPRTTRLYDRRQKSVTRNTVERISI
ncbi:MAG: tyrosine-type recombinase/integrase [Planctomycetaceae bacterium]|nr:tyrosine-type recombinase/integrase [Planctomycetaceae bacterium]